METPRRKVSKEGWSQPWGLVQAVAAGDQGEGYLPLQVDNLAAGRRAPCELYLKAYKGKGQPPLFMPCCDKGEAFPAALGEKLRQAGITDLYFAEGDLGAVIDYLQGNLEGIMADGSVAAGQKAEKVYEVSLLWVRNFFQGGEMRVGEQLKQGLTLVGHLMNLIMEDPYYQDWLLGLCCHDGQLYSHCLNTTVIGMAFVSYLGWSPLRSRDFGMGAILHDIGMTRVPAEILKKQGELTEEEKDLVKRHPLVGFGMVKGNGMVSRDTLATILQHHEHGDGSGYPEGLKLNMIDPVGRVMRIVDAYEAMTSPRSWRQQLEPVQALWTMRQEWEASGVFDTAYFTAFIKFLARQ